MTPTSVVVALSVAGGLGIAAGLAALRRKLDGCALDDEDDESLDRERCLPFNESVARGTDDEEPRVLVVPRRVA